MKKIWILFFILCSFSRVMYANITWSNPVTISTMGIDASDPKIVMDGNGNATAVWIENAIVKVSSHALNGSWGAVSSLSGSGASSPKIAVDSSGNVTALWLENGFVTTANRPFNGNWSAKSTISLSSATSPALAVDNSGNAVAVWVRSNSIESATKLILGLWGLATKISTSTASSPQVAIGSNGTVVAVWHSNISGANTITSATTLINGIWNAAVNVFTATPAFSHDFPKVAVDANGNATIIWLRYNFANNIYQNITLISASLPVGNTIWGTVTVLTTGGQIVNIANLSTNISVDTNGNALALWTMSYDGSRYNVESAIKPLGNNWGPSQALQIAALYAFQADVTDNNSIGGTLALNMEFDGISSVVIQSQESNISIPNFPGWSPGTTISQGQNNGYPVVASSLNGQTINATALWVNNNGMNNGIVAINGSKTIILAPTNLTVIQTANNYGVFTNYCNTISWTPSGSPNIVKYNIYRNGVYFTSVDPNVYQANDYNAVQNGSVTYGVSAEDSSLSLSTFAQVNFP